MPFVADDHGDQRSSRPRDTSDDAKSAGLHAGADRTSDVPANAVEMKHLRLRRPDACAVCSRPLAPGVDAWWDAAARTVTCADCHAVPAPPEVVRTEEPLERGQAGASAVREHDRRRDGRERRTRERYPRVGGLLLALRDAPQHETAWQRGAAGERAVGESLEKRVADGIVVLLHDRRMPRSRANIDHLAVTPSGVYVIDAKDYTGKVRVERPWFGEPKLLVNGRDRAKVVDGLDRQVAAVRDAINDAAIPVHGVLCFTKADIPIVLNETIGGHALLYGRALAQRLNAEGPLEAAAIDALARRLTTALPAA